MKTFSAYSGSRDWLGVCVACHQPAYLDKTGVCGPCAVDAAETAPRPVPLDYSHVHEVDACPGFFDDNEVSL